MRQEEELEERKRGQAGREITREIFSQHACPPIEMNTEGGKPADFPLIGSQYSWSGGCGGCFTAKHSIGVPQMGLG